MSKYAGQILDLDGKKDTKADPLHVKADPLRVNADLCLDIGGGKHQVGEQMLKPYIHQFPLTVRETDVLPTQLVIPHTYLAPILVNTSKPPPARCMPPNQPSTFITSQQHYEMSHCLQGQSRRYQNYFQSENDVYFGEKQFIKPTIKSPPLPSCPPPPLPPPPPSPPPLQVGRTANNADTSNIKLCSIPYIKLKVIRNIHDEKREIERIISIRKNKDTPHLVQDSLDRLLSVEMARCCKLTLLMAWLLVSLDGPSAIFRAWFLAGSGSERIREQPLGTTIATVYMQ
uniref:(California timema) hypothetical protein n=1 Tax=Timema californicum TaxID=61474 RepID=A0A7R9J391_TIMCA|nr:unnamed protein product [Timema californicum]